METTRQWATVNAAGYQITVDDSAAQFELATDVTPVADGITEVHFLFTALEPVRATPVTIAWYHPCVGVHLKWHPGAHVNRTIEADWNPSSFVSRGATNAPVYALHAADDTNALTFALSDALNAVRLSVGLVEETAEAHCQVALFCEPGAPIQSYSVTLRLDTRPVHFSSALADVSAWWALMPAYQPPESLPDAAAVPLYSSWYSFHQNLLDTEVERQCALAKPLGMDVVILDDGWQTDDNHRGYAYCGDWQVNTGKFPDFRAHVQRVHGLGMKYVLWFAVPFVGVHTQAYERFGGMLLNPENTQGWHVLDPRFPEVRAYLTDTYRRFVLDYDIDGFKLDFIDAFLLPKSGAPQVGGGRDYDSVPMAVDRLLSDVLAELRRLKPDVLIEFRQSYIGPLMRRYGNMLRAGDVPEDITGNRVRTLDIRLLAGATPVHADMLMWHPDETVESAALQVIHSLFAVPQISVLLDAVPESHVAMLRFYLGLWREHRDVLLYGSLLPHGSGYLYPQVTAATADKTVIAFYATRLARLESAPATLILINGTLESDLVLDVAQLAEEYTATSYRCTGEVVATEALVLSPGLVRVPVPPSGAAVLKRP